MLVRAEGSFVGLAKSMDLSSTESVLQAEDGIQKKTTSNPKSQTLNSKFAALGGAPFGGFGQTWGWRTVCTGAGGFDGRSVIGLF